MLQHRKDSFQSGKVLSDLVLLLDNYLGQVRKQQNAIQLHCMNMQMKLFLEAVTNRPAPDDEENSGNIDHSRQQEYLKISYKMCAILSLATEVVS